MDYYTNIIEEIPGLYKVVPLTPFRKTEGVTFDLIPKELVGKISSIDRVIHKYNAISPGPLENIERPWYMHLAQDDNLIVLQGERFVELYNKDHGKIESFTVTNTSIKSGDRIIYEGGAMLVWPCDVFHRITSGEMGSASLNFAVHYNNFDIKSNFNIYSLDEETGVSSVVREGFKDQKI